LAPKRSNQKEDDDEGSKRTKIDQYFHARAGTPLPLSQELPPDETSKATIMERLINSKSSIARYRIIDAATGYYADLSTLENQPQLQIDYLLES
ncbi:5463_t:CDS:2, partial [Paraglomus occultum]